MDSRCSSAGNTFSAITPACLRAAGLTLALLMLPLQSHAALDEVNGQNPYTLAPPVSVGSTVDFYVQIRNTGATSVNFTSFTTTGPFIWIGGTCGGSAAPGAIGLSFRVNCACAEKLAKTMASENKTRSA